MEKFVISLAALSAFAQFAFAQTPELAKEQSIQTTVIVKDIAPTAAPETVSQAQPELEKQPTTVIEASPLAVSKAEQIRKAREQAEIETEQKIVEKLEESRMEAERKRQQDILGSIAGEKKEEQPVTPPVVVQPAVAPTPAPVIAPADVQPAPSMDDVRNTVREELSAVASQEPLKKPSQNYVSASVGLLDYNSSDIETIGAFGATFGKLFEDRWAVEFGIGTARSYINDNFLYRELTQFSVGTGARFFILTGRVRPSVGFVVNYVDRNYSNYRDVSGFSFNNSELHSWAIDYGLTAGLEFAMADNFSLGMEYRYMTNLTYELSESVLNTPNYRNAFGSPYEERDSDFFGFQLKYLF